MNRLAKALASTTVLTAANDNFHLRLVRDNRASATHDTLLCQGFGGQANANDRRLISITNSGTTRSFTLGYGTTPVNPYDILSVTDTAATGHPFATQSHSYGYDLIDRLLTATATTPGNNTYAYDNLDNATTVMDATGTTTPTYNGFNQISTWGAANYTYDTKGNLLSDATRTYKWDIENRLLEIDYASGAKSNFSYDGLGRRTVDVETASGGGTTTTRYLWCGSRICQTRDGSDTVQSRILPEGEYNAVSTQKAVYMPDQLGSVRDVLDATTGSRLSSIDYSPYGAPVQTNGSFTPVYQYAGLFNHPQSALLLSFTRAYDPVHPHWLNRDWIREAGGINLYAYVLANPVRLIDAEGLCASDPNKCGKLASQIEQVRDELAQRSDELKQDKLNLPPTGPMSVAGHQQQFQDKQTQLRNLLNDYDSNGCGPGDPIPTDAWKYATMPTPTKTQHPIDQMPSAPIIPPLPWWAPLAPLAPLIIRGTGSLILL